MNSSVSSSFSLSSVNEKDSIKLEQKEFGDGTGKITMLDIVDALAYATAMTAKESNVNCGMSDDGKSFDTVIYAYPYPQDLVYDSGLTHGWEMSTTVETVRMTDNVSFSLSAEAELEYPPGAFISESWLSEEVYDGEGNVVPKPAVTLNGAYIKLEYAVYGTLQVTYNTVRHNHIVKIPAREEAFESFFHSVFFVRFSGGIEMLEVNEPSGAEENYAAGTTCSEGSNFGGGTTIISPDGYEPPIAKAKNITISLSYCEDAGNE